MISSLLEGIFEFSFRVGKLANKFYMINQMKPNKPILFLFF